MSDIAAIAAALSALKNANDLVNVFKTSTTSLKDAENKNKLAELIGALADIKVHVADIKVQLIEKDDKIRELESKLKTKDDLEFKGFSYYLGADGPFCQVCYDKDEKLVRLQDNGSGYWECKGCKNPFHDPGQEHTRGTRALNRIRRP